MDLTEFQQIADEGKPKRCAFGRAVDTLGAEEAAKVEAAIAQGHHGGTLTAYLARRQVEVSRTSADNHRRRGCLCFRAQASA